MKVKIAIASTDGKVVNQHFGRADTFYIVLVNPEESIYEYLEKREFEPVCLGGGHEEDRLQKAVDRLMDCQYVLVSKIGIHVQSALEKSDIQVYEIPGIIEDSIDRLLKYVEIKKMLNGEN